MNVPGASNSVWSLSHWRFFEFSLFFRGFIKDYLGIIPDSQLSKTHMRLLFANELEEVAFSNYSDDSVIFNNW